MLYKLNLVMDLGEHQDAYEEFILIIHEHLGEINELDIQTRDEQFLQEIEILFSSREDAVNCKRSLRQRFELMELSEIERYA
jgi:hypothetical protein